MAILSTAQLAAVDRLPAVLNANELTVLRLASCLRGPLNVYWLQGAVYESAAERLVLRGYVTKCGDRRYQVTEKGMDAERQLR